MQITSNKYVQITGSVDQVMNATRQLYKPFAKDKIQARFYLGVLSDQLFSLSECMYNNV